MATAPVRPPRSRHAIALRVGLATLAAAAVLWVRVLPLSLPTVDENEQRAELLYRGADGRDHVYLGDYDSYLWLRHARNQLRSGTTCDAVVDGECRDTYANAPVGRRMLYARSLHIAAIVGLHRVITLFQPGYPLEATAFWVPVVVAVLGTLPAFLLGDRFAGPLGGLAAALLVGVEPVILMRTIGGDNDIWNVVLPLGAVWAAVEAVSAERSRPRAAYAVLATVFAGLQASAWRGWVFVYGVVALGLVGNLVLLALGGAGRRALRGAVLPLVVFAAGVPLLAASVGTGESTRLVPRRLATLLAPERPVATVDVVWPDPLATVAELQRPSLHEIASRSQGQAYLFAAWAGMLLVLLPVERWRWWHLALLAGGSACFGVLVLLPDPPRLAVACLLGLPLAAVLIVAIARRDDSLFRAGLIVVLWLLAALFQTSARRFLILLEPPLSVLAAVTVGRFHTALRAATARLPRLADAPLTGALVFALAAMLVVPAVRRGVATARSYLPRVHDAWWDALTHIRDATPADAVVDTTWDYGHWVKYAAERPVTADGASLRTHVPYWISRALMAQTERESIGILRMLNCGSDATPDPEGRRGAYGKLVALGIDGLTAQSMIVALANLDRTGAAEYLAARGLASSAAEDVLASTHCTPPPAYLLLSGDLARARGMRQLGNWDFSKAWAARVARTVPEPDAVRQIEARLSLSETDARALRAAAAVLETEADVRRFAGPDPPYLWPQWFPCGPGSTPKSWRCPIRRPLDASELVLNGLVFRLDAPESSAFAVQRKGTPPGQPYQIAAPGLIVVARADTSEEVSLPAATLRDVAVLVDMLHRRILVGPPSLIRSTFTHLFFLDGRYARHFKRFDDRVGKLGERIVTWQIVDANP